MMIRRSFLWAAFTVAATPALAINRLIIRGHGSTSSPPSPPPVGPPPPAGSTTDFVMVTRGVSQAAIQVVKPTQDLVTIELAGGTGAGGIGAGNSYDLVLNDANLNSRGIGSTVVALPYAFWDNLFGSIDGQWHTTFQGSPANTAGEVVTIITVGAAGDSYTAKTLAQVQALAPKMFQAFTKGQRPFNLLSPWNTRIPYNTSTYTAIAWPTSTGFNYGTAWDDFSPGVYISLPTDPLVTVTYPAGWGNPGPSVQVHLAASTFTASISGTTMTVTGAPSSPIQLGMIVLGVAGVTAGTRVIFPKLTGTGGAGTYTVSISQTVTSRSMTFGVSGAVGTDGEILILDGTTVHNFWQFLRTGLTTGTSSSYAFANAILDDGWGTASPFKGAGIAAAGSSELAGLLVQEETDWGDLKHALALRVDAATNLGNTGAPPGFVAPAIAGDGAATSAPPGIVQTGWRLGIPPLTVMPGGLSPLGQKVFKCLQQYGCYVYDSTGGVYGFRADPLGYDAATISSFDTDNAVLIRLLQRVT